MWKDGRGPFLVLVAMFVLILSYGRPWSSLGDFLGVLAASGLLASIALAVGTALYFSATLVIRGMWRELREPGYSYKFQDNVPDEWKEVLDEEISKKEILLGCVSFFLVAEFVIALIVLIVFVFNGIPITFGEFLAGLLVCSLVAPIVLVVGGIFYILVNHTSDSDYW